MNQILMQGAEEFNMRLASIEGGSLRNAIPRESFAVVVLPESEKDDFKKFIVDFEENAKLAFKDADPGLMITASSTKMPSHIIDKETQDRLCHAIASCPNGVVAMSKDMPGVVETSTNLAIVKSGSDTIEIASLQRSSVDEDKASVSREVYDILKEAAAKVEISGDYPGWKPNVDSPILHTMKEVYEARFGKVPEVKVIHAGLECGILGAKYPNWDMISFGPTIRNPHSPDEMVNIKTVEMFWDFLLETLKHVPEK
jgi:dipeptidase D